MNDLNISGSRTAYAKDDPLLQQLHSEVFDHIATRNLPTKKPLPECIALLIIFYVSYLSTIYAGFVFNWPLLCLLSGPVASLMAVNIEHTIVHGAFSSSRVVNLLGQGLGDATGYSSGSRDVEYQRHYRTFHSSMGLQTIPASDEKFAEHQKSRWQRKYQTIYLWLLFTVYSPVSWVIHSCRSLFVYRSVTGIERLHLFIFKLFGFVLPIALGFYYNSVIDGLLCFAVYSVSISYFYVFTSFVQHEQASLPSAHSNSLADSWAARQIQASVSWRANNHIFEWLSGYFNYRIEHHLFPDINPSLYPEIQPIVKRICRQHGVTYKHLSYQERLRSKLRAWKAYSLSLSPTP